MAKSWQFLLKSCARNPEASPKWIGGCGRAGDRCEGAPGPAVKWAVAESN
jgi:hypothetical protein